MYLAHPFALGAAVVFLVAGIVLYRRRGREDKKHGSQGAVILLVVGAILAIYGLGLMEYRP
jgi:formate hydrogenlyase subunit 3/multisubunit Na+/H+ antiporter MnhD subunit